MTRTSLDRASIVMGGAAIVCCLFVFADSVGSTLNFIHVRGASIVVLVVFGALAIVAGAYRQPLLSIASGFGLLACAILQLVQLGQDVNLLGGDASTMALFGGLGIGLVIVGFARRNSLNVSKGSS